MAAAVCMRRWRLLRTVIRAMSQFQVSIRRTGGGDGMAIEGAGLTSVRTGYSRPELAARAERSHGRLVDERESRL